MTLDPEQNHGMKERISLKLLNTAMQIEKSFWELDARVQGQTLSRFKSGLRLLSPTSEKALKLAIAEMYVIKVTDYRAGTESEVSRISKLAGRRTRVVSQPPFAAIQLCLDAHYENSIQDVAVLKAGLGQASRSD